MGEEEELEIIRRKKIDALRQDIDKKDVKKVAGNVEVITDESFDKFVRQDKLVVVDCWAPWCGPCRAVAPKLEELSKEMADKIAIGKINTDENEQIPMRFNISAIPTILLFKNGTMVDRIVGAGTKEFMKARFEKFL